MRLKIMAAGLTALTAVSGQAHAAALDYECSSAKIVYLLERTRERGHTALFYYRLNRAIAAGKCAVTGEGVSAEPKIAYSGPAATYYYRYREERFPPPWLFRPLR